MQNSEIAAVLEEFANLLEIQGANTFRVRAYRTAARTVGDSADSIAALAADPKKLTELPGIGADLAGKIHALVSTGSVPQLEELRKEIPAGVLEMLRIPGLGPKKAAALFHELNVQSLADLKAAAESGRVAKLKGMGEKTAQLILKGLAQVEQTGRRMLLAEALAAAEEIAGRLAAVPGVSQTAIGGSCRRRKDTVGDLDVLVSASDSSAAMDALADHRLTSEVLSRGDTKMRVRLSPGIELDLRVLPEESFGAALQYFTGSKEHNVELRRRAQAQGLKLNEWGLFREDTLVAGRTEEDVYRALRLPWIPPELREARQEFAWAEQGRLPKLLELGDIRGDLHMHTTATDGAASIEEMIAAAKERGREYIAITDHSQRVSMANGLNPSRLRAHWKEIDRIRKKTRGIQVLCGVECDILENADLDLPDDVLAEADWVLAVLHYGLQQPREQIMQRLLNAVRNPHVDAIGHPSGRMLTKRPGADIDFDLLLRAAADHGKWLEINAHPSRLDLDDVHAAAAKDRRIPIVINTDAHSTTGMDVMQYGVFQARRAGLTASDVANTRPWGEFQKLLQR